MLVFGGVARFFSLHALKVTRKTRLGDVTEPFGGGKVASNFSPKRAVLGVFFGG